MAEVSVFMSEDDLEQIVAELLAAGCTLIPKTPSALPKAHEILSLESFQEWRASKRTGFYFVVSSEWSVAPFEWFSIEKNGNSEFHIYQKTGGPTLDIFLPLPDEAENGKPVIPGGFIGYHSTFWNPLTSQKESPPPVLKATYRRVIKKLSAGADQITAHRRRYIVAAGAKAKLATGHVLGAPFNTN